MNCSCPFAFLLKSRGLLLTFLVVVPFGVLLGFAVGGRLSERAAADPGATCPAARGAGTSAENSCESMHVRLQRGAAAADSAPEPAAAPVWCPRTDLPPQASGIE